MSLILNVLPSQAAQVSRAYSILLFGYLVRRESYYT